MRAAGNKPVRGLRRQAAFTLIELITVIAIIGLLVSMVMAATSELKKKARARQAEAMARALELAIRDYHAEYGYWPGPSPESGGSWSNNDNSVITSYLLSSGNNRRRTFWETPGVASNPFTRRDFIITINVTNNTVTVN